MKTTYEEVKVTIMHLDTCDVLTASPQFQDPNTGDNGIYFPDDE